ncbi:DedA family protein [Virgibacillus halophilus]|uniref:DedA family protein n=1 Tax=Tigheibacillus halophilus TaxID=361280 RepID=UPI0036384CE6
MQNWIMEVMEQFGYAGILLMMALENLFPPIPSEVILPFGGFMTSYTSMTFTGVLVTSTTGSLLGAVILYVAGRMLSVERLGDMVDRHRRIFPFKKKDLERGNDWFLKYGPWTVLFCRMIPLVRSVISIPAGMTKMNVTLFTTLTLIGTLIWNFLLVYIGVLLGNSWTKIFYYMEIYSSIVYLSLGAGILLLLVVWIRNKMLKQ